MSTTKVMDFDLFDQRDRLKTMLFLPLLLLDDMMRVIVNNFEVIFNGRYQKYNADDKPTVRDKLQQRHGDLPKSQ